MGELASTVKKLEGAGPLPAAGPGGPAAPVFSPQAPEQGSLVMSIVGAALGAGAGATIWFVLEMVTGYAFGYVACLVGALAGWGAVWVGKRKNKSVGMIAAALGLAGVFAGSYLSFYVGFHRLAQDPDAYRKKIEAEIAKDPQQAATYNAMTEDQKKAAIEYSRQKLVNMGYFDAMAAGEAKDTGLMALFSFFGLYYGYRVGAGTIGKKKAA
jgi:hypothetical protein